MRIISRLYHLLYGGVLLAAAFVYLILQQTIIASQGSESPLKAAIVANWEGELSPVLYLCAIISTFLWLWGGSGAVRGGSDPLARASSMNEKSLTWRSRLTARPTRTRAETPRLVNVAGRVPQARREPSGC